MSPIRVAVPVLLALAGSAPASAAADDFALKGGDTVVFLGDSITAARAYGKLIENYTLLRFPDRRVKFVNAGVGGDTAAGGLKRLDRDVFAHRPTVVTVAYGVNDIGWGTRADDAHKAAYLAGIRGIVEACRARNVRVYVCSAAATAEDPDKSAVGYLKTMCDEGMALSRSLGGGAIDVQGSMRDAQRKLRAANKSVADKAKHDSLHVADGVHLNELGQLAMAYAILKGLGAPAGVSSVTVDAKTGAAAPDGCTVTDVTAGGGGVEFTRLDRGLPFNYGPFYQFNYRYVPVPDGLNRYTLAVTSLPAGRYDVTADGRGLGTYSADQLAAGVNVSSATTNGWEPGGPWDAQATALRALTDARHDVLEADAGFRRRLPGSPTADDLGRQAAAVDADLVAVQRATAKPRPYRFTVKPAVPPKAGP